MHPIDWSRDRMGPYQRPRAETFVHAKVSIACRLAAVARVELADVAGDGDRVSSQGPCALRSVATSCAICGAEHRGRIRTRHASSVFAPLAHRHRICSRSRMPQRARQKTPVPSRHHYGQTRQAFGRMLGMPAWTAKALSVTIVRLPPAPCPQRGSTVPNT